MDDHNIDIVHEINGMTIASCVDLLAYMENAGRGLLTMRCCGYSKRVILVYDYTSSWFNMPDND